MKKLLSLVLCLVMVISIFNGVTVSATTEAEKTTGASVLDGKKVMFIGNSYTYYGKTVLEKTQAVLKQADRDNDKGFFYQICKNNGAEVDVTNWTFGAHAIEDLFVECSANRGCDGVDHKSYLVDRDYDYVVIQQGSGGGSDPDIVGWVKLVMDFFKEANPDTKFIFLVQQQAYVSSYAWLPYLDDLEEMGVTVVNWGQVVYNIMRNYLEVPGAKETYNKNSFVVCQSATDGYHPNMLSGYITSLMTYCAITGESAVGQDYSFCNDTTINSAFDLDKYAAKYYTYDGATTNFPEIFESADDMKGIQQIIDATLDENVPYFKTNLNTTEPYTGENVLSVEVEVSEGTLSYQWYKDGVVVEGATSSSYTATEPATYKVEVTNTLNGVPYKMTSKECLVDYAMEKPVVSIENGTSIEIAKGDAVTLRAKATSSDGGALTYKWYKDGKAISSVSTYDIYTAKSEGTYKVVVTNSGDKNPATASAEIVVTVNDKSENIALNKTYEWVDTTIFNSSYPDTDTKEMTDGNIPESVSYTNKGLTTAKSGKSLSMIIDLGDGCQFNAVKLAYASSYSAGLKMAGRMTAEYSNDKKTWTPMGSWTNSNIAQKGVLVAEVRSATPISARYVRITDSGSSNTGLHFMSEALVIGSVDPKAALDDKKVIFVGDSGIYNGKAVLEKASTVLTQEERTGDEGLFYQLCKENGIDVSVTNWAFDGHNLNDLFEECTAGCEVDHKNYLTDKNYDYVVIQESDDEDFLTKVETVMNFFKEGNADTQFILLVQPKAHTDAYEWLADLAELEEMGVEVVDWGNLVYGVMNNMLTVSGTESYNKNSFITSQSEDDSDPNVLSGYLMSLMTYSAITGESAVGKSYDFCSDFDFDAYCNEYYTDGATTNFPEIFASADDMNSLQELADLTLDGVIPVITKDLGAEATFSDRTVISVEAQAKKGKLSYRWYKDGIIIDGATESSYTVDEPGEYKVDVINKYNDVKYTMVSKTCTLVQTFESDHLLKGVAPSDYTVNGWGFDGTKDVSILTDGVLHTDNKSYKKNITFSNFPASFEYDKELTFREIDISA